MLAAFSASAEVIDRGQYTYDSDTGLYWLDVTITQGLTYAQVNQRLAPGGPLASFRYATHAELETLLQHFGIPPQGNTCYATSFAGTLPLYCDDINAAYAELLETVIRTLGDTEASILNPNPFDEDVSPNGAGMTRGIIVPAAGTAMSGGQGIVWLEDGEYVYGGGPGGTAPLAGQPYADQTDEIRSLYPWSPPTSLIRYYGSFLVSTTEPVPPINVSLNPIPAPVVPAGGQVLFAGLSPDSLGLGIHCEYPYASGPCGYSSEGFAASTAEDYGNTYSGAFNLYKDGINDQQLPWMRIVGFDMTNVACSTSANIGHPGTIISATDLSLYEGGSGVCRFELADVDYSFLPAVTGISVIPGTAITNPAIYGAPYAGFGMDNVVLQFISGNMLIDFSPGNAGNTVFPKRPGWTFLIAALSTSIADGDAFDFDATTIDPATVVAGRSAATPLAYQLMDVDGDGDMDMNFQFSTGQSGVQCLDEVIGLMGRTNGGEPLAGSDTIAPQGCTEIIDIDVDPFNAANIIRPNDNYDIPVGLLRMTKASGDAIDFDPTQVDPTTLKFGPAETPITGTPITSDLDGDSNVDMLVRFNAFNSGIACGETEVTLTGELYSGLPISGTDTIQTEDCDTGCHP